MSRKNPAISPELRDILSTRPGRDTYDVWNSSSTGHQQSDGSSSQVAAYMQLRAEKLARQFGSAAKGNQNRDSPKQFANSRGGKDIRDFFGGVRKQAKPTQFKLSDKKDSDSKMKKIETVVTSAARGRKHEGKALDPKSVQQDAVRTKEDEVKPKDAPQRLASPKLKIFEHLTVYINGSTSHTISDHKLKNLLVANGATLALSLARRTVTHVVISKPSSSASRNGTGGGLAAGKLQDEVRRAGVRGVKYISAEWSVIVAFSSREHNVSSRYTD